MNNGDRPCCTLFYACNKTCFYVRLLMIGIVDYNAGNIKSVERSLLALNIEYAISKAPLDLVGADKIIFPGVGEARFAMEQLKKTGFDSFIKDFTAEKKPLLGICLGSQVIFEHSEESDVECLGLVKGNIRHFNSVLPADLQKSLKIPHMGWSSVEFANADVQKNCPILANVPNHADFYFVHSYLIQPEDDSVVAAFADYGVKVPAVIHSENIFACQFHPEKSAKYGLALLKSFCEGQFYA